MRCKGSRQGKSDPSNGPYRGKTVSGLRSSENFAVAVEPMVVDVGRQRAFS